MNICFLLLSVLAIINHVNAVETVEYRVSDGSGYRICIKLTDENPCPPDHQIEICQENYTELKCVPCKHGLRQCDKTTSALPTPCYDPAIFCSANGDNIVIVTNLTSGGCNIRCQCNEARGHTGSNSNHCDDNKFPCRPTHTRAIVGGDCYPCRDGYHNPWDDGVDECIEKPARTEPGEPNSAEITVGPTTSKQTQSTLSATLPVATDTPSQQAEKGRMPDVPAGVINNKLNIDKLDHLSKTTDNTQWVIIGILSVFLAGVIIYLIIYCRQRTKRKDHNDVLELGEVVQEANNNRATDTSGIKSEPVENEESLEPLIQSASGGPKPSTKLEAGKPPSAGSSSSTIASIHTPNVNNSFLDIEQHPSEVSDDELYQRTKEVFTCDVNPVQLLPFLKLNPAVDERIGEIQELRGRAFAAHQLLIRLVQQHSDWPNVVCEALRHYQVQLHHVADVIEENQRQLNDTVNKPSDPEALVCQEVGDTEADLSYSSFNRKQQTEVKQID